MLNIFFLQKGIVYVGKFGHSEGLIVIWFVEWFESFHFFKIMLLFKMFVKTCLCFEIEATVLQCSV